MLGPDKVVGLSHPATVHDTTDHCFMQFLPAHLSMEAQ